MGFKESAYLKYLRGDKSVLTEDGMSDQERNAYSQMAEIAWNRPTASKGQMQYQNYPNTYDMHQIRHTIGATGIDPRFVPEGKQKSDGYIRREGNYWRIKDNYNFAQQKKPLKKSAELLMNGQAMEALAAASSALNQNSYPVDIQIPLSSDQLKRLGNNELTYDGQNYTYEPYQFAKGETVEQAVKKAFANSTFKPEGTNLKNYIARVQQRNKLRGDGDTSYYIPQAVSQLPSNRLPQQKKPLINALDLISKHIGSFTGF